MTPNVQTEASVIAVATIERDKAIASLDFLKIIISPIPHPPKKESAGWF